MPHRELTTEALDCLRQCAWRGNIRELQNVLEKAVMLTDRLRIGVADLAGILPLGRVKSFSPSLPSSLSRAGGMTRNSNELRSYEEEFVDFERRILTDALTTANNRVDEAARLLGLGRATMYRKMRSLGLRVLSQE